MRKITWITILTLLIITTTATISYASTPRVALDLDQAISHCLKNNQKLYIAGLDLEQAEKALARAELIADDKMIKDATETLDQQKSTYSITQRDLITSVRNSYYELLQQEATVVNQKKALERAENQLALDHTKFKAGIISTIDLQRAENSMQNAQLAYENVTIDLATKYMRFNDLLGLDLATEVELTQSITVEFTSFTVELDAAYDLALAVDQNIITAKENLTKAQEAVRAADNQFTPKVELEKALVAQDKAEVRLVMGRNDLYFIIRSDFLAVQNAANAVITRERELRLEQQLLQAEEAKYTAGVTSNEVVVAQQEKLAQSELAYTQALWNYSQQRSSFLTRIGTPENWWGESDAN